MTSNPGRVGRQLELPFDPPALDGGLCAKLAAHVAPGWPSMAACRSVADDTWFPPESAEAKALAVWAGTTEGIRRYLAVDMAEGALVDAVLGCADSSRRVSA
jgi:hypothetical protein